MTDAVATALTTAAAGVITTAVTLTAKIILAKIAGVKAIVNGRLTDLLARLERAEARCPGITRIPDHMDTKAVLTVNDPSNNDPPVVQITETKRAACPLDASANGVGTMPTFSDKPKGATP